jgi:hypothetical protein
MPAPTKPQYGLVLENDEELGVWRTVGGNKIEINLPDEAMKKIMALAEEQGATVQFLIDPKMIEEQQ